MPIKWEFLKLQFDTKQAIESVLREKNTQEKKSMHEAFLHYADIKTK